MIDPERRTGSRARADRPFLVLERLRGRTLKEELRARGVLPPSEAVRLARELLEALGCAHEVGIVHRDVKPENIFLAESEREGRTLKLLDFGLAKVLPGASDEEAPLPLEAPTEEGMPLGTPRFVSPEQARGGTIDHRSDLYSAGSVLYAMLTGRDPFAYVEGVSAVLRAQMSEHPRPPSFVAAQPIPEALDQIVLKALSKQPEDRFASAADMSAALDGALSSPQAVGWDTTEEMDVMMFHGAARRECAPRLPEKTELLDVSVFRGALARRSPVKIAEMAPPASAVPEPVRRNKARPRRMAMAVLLAAVLVGMSLLMVLLSLPRLR
jgi:eukaryotic-like serine/threonine-protein kinase